MSDGRELHSWLAAHPHGAGRRVVRVTSRSVLLSKFEPGFFEQLDATLEALPFLLDAEIVSEAYATTAIGGRTRAEAWRLAMLLLLSRAQRDGSLDARQRAEVMAGVDSVAALVEASLWTDPGAAQPWQPASMELAALDELAGRLAPDGDLFTRRYGSFDGKSVINHCPGSRYARRLFELARSTILGSSG